MVNDNDATVALKYTYKGISGLGEDGSSVQPIYKYVDPSHIGIIDLDSSSNSDPGMSGMLCPMTKMYGRNFSKFEEPHEWYNKYKKLEKRYYRKYAESPIIFDQPPEPFHYKERREKIVQEEIEFNKIICPIINMDNPDITYASYQSTIEDNREQDKTVQSLFTIIKDETGSGNDADTSEQAFISDDFEEDFF
jgi:hypothetical protein